jgi:hypothetical protein
MVAIKESAGGLHRCGHRSGNGPIGVNHPTDRAALAKRRLAACCRAMLLSHVAPPLDLR